MKCQAKDCKCLIEARPFKVECDDGDKFLGCFCPCHSVALYLVILDYDPMADSLYNPTDPAERIAQGEIERGLGW